MGKTLRNNKDRKINHSFSCEEKIRREFEEKALFDEKKTLSGKIREFMIIYIGKEDEYGIKKTKK